MIDKEDLIERIDLYLNDAHLGTAVSREQHGIGLLNDCRASLRRDTEGAKLGVEYVLSYVRREERHEILPRPWWKVFGRDRIITNEVWERHYRTIDPQLAGVLKGKDLLSDPAGRLIALLVKGDAVGLQLWEDGKLSYAHE